MSTDSPNQGDTKLEACPWCGEPPSRHDNPDWYYLECMNSKCSVNPSTSGFLTLEMTVKAWNTRASSNQVQELTRENAELKALLEKWKSKYTCCKSDPECSNNQTKKLCEEILGDMWSDKHDKLYCLIETMETDYGMDFCNLRGELTAANKRIGEIEKEFEKLSCNYKAMMTGIIAPNNWTHQISEKDKVLARLTKEVEELKEYKASNASLSYSELEVLKSEIVSLRKQIAHQKQVIEAAIPIINEARAIVLMGYDEQDDRKAIARKIEHYDEVCKAQPPLLPQFENRERG